MCIACDITPLGEGEDPKWRHHPLKLWTRTALAEYVLRHVLYASLFSPPPTFYVYLFRTTLSRGPLFDYSVCLIVSFNAHCGYYIDEDPLRSFGRNCSLSMSRPPQRRFRVYTRRECFQLSCRECIWMRRMHRRQTVRHSCLGVSFGVPCALDFIVLEKRQLAIALRDLQARL